MLSRAVELNTKLGSLVCTEVQSNKSGQHTWGGICFCLERAGPGPRDAVPPWGSPCPQGCQENTLFAQLWPEAAHAHFFRGEHSKRQRLDWERSFPSCFSLPAVPGPPVALALFSRPLAVPLLRFCSILLRMESQSLRLPSSVHARGCACRATAMQQQAVLVSLAGAGGILAPPLPPAPSFQPLHQPCFAHGPGCRAFLQ